MDKGIPGALRYGLMEYSVTDEERQRYQWGAHVTSVFWLVRWTDVLDAEGRFLMQTNHEQVAWFNHDSEARLFQHYLGELEDRAKAPT